jgi:ATP-binding cassette subfamily B protein
MIIEEAAAEIGVEVEPVDTCHRDVESMLRSSAPALVIVHDECRAALFLILAGRRRSLVVLRPDLRTARIPIAEIRCALCETIEAPLRASADAVLERARVPPRRRARARAALIAEQLGRLPVSGCWLLRTSAASPLRLQARKARLALYALAIVLGHGMQYAAWCATWWIIGEAIFAGRLHAAVVIIWSLLLASAVPFQLLESWSQARFGLAAGALLKRRLLAGALRLDPESIRQEGAGHLLARVFDAESVESLGVEGGITALVAVIEVATTLCVLAAARPGSVVALAFVAWVLVVGVLEWRTYRARQCWTASRLILTNDLVEKMMGHRTRLVQQSLESWHEDEDPRVAEYLDASSAMDRRMAWAEAIAVRGWLVVGMVALMPAFTWGRPSRGAVAIAVGGVLLGAEALRKFAVGFTDLASAGIAWQRIRELLAAAAHQPRHALRGAARPRQRSGGAAIEARGVSYRYPCRAEAALRGCTLIVREGDRVVLEGSSGCGKSTLAAVLAGLRRPDAGLLLIGGVDSHAFGDRDWRKRVAAAPQFHENHILTGSLAFNVLLGRGWPPSEQDLEDAEAVCVDLGLQPLLERMPGGLMETVGETGWQLSHGERSRIYLARALLQGADVTVLDETFAALDPESLQRCVAATLDRAPTLIAIAHP